MSAKTDTWVLCGGASHPDAPDDALALAVSGKEANLTVDIAGISTAIGANVPAAFKDLIRVAAYVLAADQATRRGQANDVDLGLRWRRSFRFVVTVEDLALWQGETMRELLSPTLAFLSDDDYTFEFQPLVGREPEQLTFSMPDGEAFLGWKDIEAVQLFSGGLDSLAGAAEQVLKKKRKVIVVSHRSANKTWKTQKYLLDQLHQRATVEGPAHVAIRVLKHDKKLRRERTQRSRSFLYAAIAGAVADLVGCDAVDFYENGTTGLNIPISPQLVGAKATRTTHPRVLRGYARILSLVAGRGLAVTNGYELKTRTEVLERLNACEAADLIKYAVSCAHVHTSSNMHPHCGRCSQCIDRRFAVLACDLAMHDPEEGYAIDLIKDGRKDEIDQTLLINYVETADRFAACTNPDEFLAQFGAAALAIPSMMDAMQVDADTASRVLFELHQRQGQAVGRVVQGVFAQYAKEIRTPGGLPSTSLPMLLFARARAGDQVAPPKVQDPALQVSGEYVFRQFGESWTIRFRGGQALPMQPSKGLLYLRLLIERPGEMLTAFSLLDLADGRAEASRPMSTSLGIDQEAIDSVREMYDNLKADRDEAREFCDQVTIARCEKEMEELARYLQAGTRLGGRPRDETPDQKRARDAVSSAVRRAIAKINKQSPSLATHLHDQVRTGFFLKYGDTGIPWQT